MFNVLNPKTWFNKSNEKSQTTGSAVFGNKVRFAKPNVLERLLAYKSNDWVYAAVDLRAEVFSDIEIKLFRKNAKGEKIEVMNHPALDMLKRPNAHVTTSELLEVTSIHLDLAGQAFWFVDKIAKTIWWLPPQNVEILADPVKFIRGYKYRNGQTLTEFSPDQIVHFRKPDPSDLYGATAPIEASTTSFNLDQQAAEWNGNFFKQGGGAAVLLYFKKKLGDGVFKKFVNQYRANYEGIENGHKTQWLDTEVGKVDLDRTQRDMQFSELQHDMRDKLLSGGFRVSKSLIGLDENSNRATIEGTQYGFRQFTNRPRLRRFFSKINTSYVEIFGKFYGQELFFDFVDSTPQDEEHKLKTRNDDLDRGVLSINEARAGRGLEPIEGGETPRVQASTIKIDEEPHTNEAPINEKTVKKKIQKPLRGKILKNYLKRFTGNELKITRELKQLFSDHEARVLKNIKRDADKLTKNFSEAELKGRVDDVLGDRLEESERVLKKILPTIVLMAEKEGQLAISELGLSAPFVVSKIKPKLEKQTQKFAKQITATSFTMLKKELNAGIQNGESEKELSDRVKTVFTGAKTYRTKTIARTETNKASNLAHKTAYEDLGIKKREWVSSHDADSRPTHEAADGQVVKTNEKFTVAGEKLNFPCDPNGSAGNVINCRCRTIAAFDD